MSLAGRTPYEQQDFGGAWLLPDMTTVDERGALLSKNCEFVKGQVATRSGYALLYQTGEGVSNLFNWVSEIGNYLLYWGITNGIRIFDTTAGSITPQTIQGSRIPGNNSWMASFAPFGTRVGFVARYIANTPIATPPKITSLVSATFVNDYIAPGPMSYTPSAPTEATTGVITAGLHRLGYRILTRSGWLGRPSPDSSSTAMPTAISFTPVVFTSAGLKNLSWTLNPSDPGWPADGFSVQIMMSIVTNPNRYFLVPGAIATLPQGGGTGSVTIAWSISDDDLQAQGVECTDSLNLFSNPPYTVLTVSTTNTASPIQVTTSAHNLANYNEVYISGVLGQTGANGTWFIIVTGASTFTLTGSTSVSAYTSGGKVQVIAPDAAAKQGVMDCYMIAFASNRAYYLNRVTDNSASGLIDQIYVSDPGDFQSFTPDLHVVQLPGLRNIRSVFSLLGSVYIVGPHWTYVTTDTGDVPASWPGPFLVDGEKGTLVTGGVAVSPSGRYAWVADVTGLYYFDGSFAPTPVSYYQTPDWQRIDWVASVPVLTIKDDPSSHKVNVSAVFTGSSTPVMMSWDYTNGMSPEAVRYSLDDVASAGPTSIELVQNDTSGTTQKNGLELWWSRAGDLLRKTGSLTPAVYHDYTNSAIHWIYETYLHPQGGSGGNWFKYAAAHYRVRGAGTLSVTVYSYDRLTSAGPYSITLATAPGYPVLQQFDLNSPGAFHHFETNVADTQCVLAMVRTYYSPWAGHF